jgi:hypothetical protein
VSQRRAEESRRNEEKRHQLVAIQKELVSKLQNKTQAHLS